MDSKQRGQGRQMLWLFRKKVYESEQYRGTHGVIEDYHSVVVSEFLPAMG
jgi:hypothetical protein